jgi:hypothetical protein
MAGLEPGLVATSVALFVGALTFTCLELWWKAQLGAIVCPLSQDGREEQIEAATAMFVTGTLFILFPFSLGLHLLPLQAWWVFFLTGPMIWEIGVYTLVKVRWIGAKLGEGGFQPLYGRVIRWRDIISCQWTGNDGSELIVHRITDENKSARVTFHVPLMHKATVERYLAKYLPGEKREGGTRR